MNLCSIATFCDDLIGDAVEYVSFTTCTEAAAIKLLIGEFVILTTYKEYLSASRLMGDADSEGGCKQRVDRLLHSNWFFDDPFRLIERHLDDRNMVLPRRLTSLFLNLVAALI